MTRGKRRYLLALVAGWVREVARLDRQRLEAEFESAKFWAGRPQ